MRRFLGVTLALFIALPAAWAEEPADAIQQVIVSQLDALRADDLTAAFAYASPTIQSKFGSADVFGRMVETGYPVIWRPASYEMQALVDTAAGPVQKVLMQDGAGRLYEVAYEMRLIDGIWRINGVYLRKLPDLGS